MCRDDPLARQAIQERSQRENSLWVKMRLGFLKQGEEVGLESAVGAETEPRKGLEDKHRSEAPTAEPVLAKR